MGGLGQDPPKKLNSDENKFEKNRRDNYKRFAKLPSIDLRRAP